MHIEKELRSSKQEIQKKKYFLKTQEPASQTSTPKPVTAPRRQRLGLNKMNSTMSHFAQSQSASDSSPDFLDEQLAILRNYMDEG
jgi:hypothetical protein